MRTALRRRGRRCSPPQKGATPAQVELLTAPSRAAGEVYRGGLRRRRRATLAGGGAAGGLAGGLAALGGELVAGFDLVADELDLAERIDGGRPRVTGEGFLDAQSFDGKVVGGVERLAARHQRPVVAIAGDVYDDARGTIEAYSLVDRFGDERARCDTLECVDEVVSELLAGWGISRRSSPSSGSCHPPAT